MPPPLLQVSKDCCFGLYAPLLHVRPGVSPLGRWAPLLQVDLDFPCNAAADDQKPLLEALHRCCRGPRTDCCATAGGGARAVECIPAAWLTIARPPLLQVGKDTDEPGYLKDRLSTMNDQETANLLWSFAKFGYHPLPLVPDFLAAIDRVSTELPL